MQHTSDPAGHYKRIDIRKPRFQRAPVAPAAVSKVKTLFLIGTIILGNVNKLVCNDLDVWFSGRQTSILCLQGRRTLAAVRCSVACITCWWSNRTRVSALMVRTCRADREALLLPPPTLVIQCSNIADASCSRSNSIACCTLSPIAVAKLLSLVWCRLRSPKLLTAKPAHLQQLFKPCQAVQHRPRGQLRRKGRAKLKVQQQSSQMPPLQLRLAPQLGPQLAPQLGQHLLTVQSLVEQLPLLPSR